MKHTGTKGFPWGALAIVLMLSASAGIPADVTELEGQLLFTIPWGEDWGKLKFISREELSEAMYDGPSAMLVAPGGTTLYVYDPGLKRLQKFATDGKFLAGAQLELGTPTIDILALARPPEGGKDWSIVMADNSAFYIAKLEKFGPTPGPAQISPILKGAIPPGTHIYNIGAMGCLCVEEKGLYESMPYVRAYTTDPGGVTYIRRFEMVDLVSRYSRYYGLALDRTGSELYRTESGELMALRIHRCTGWPPWKEIPITLPAVGEKRLRWHLIGAGGHGGWAILFFAKRTPLFADDDIYVYYKGRIVGTAKVAVPGGKERGRYLKRWRHHASIADNGDLYLGIPDEKGFAVVRYKPPVTPDYSTEE